MTGSLSVSSIQNIDAKHEVSIKMLEKALISGSEVYLKDIAITQSSDEALEKEICMTQICKAPEPGSIKTVYIGYIKSRLRQQGVAIECISWIGSKQTTIEAKTSQLSTQEIISYAKAFILSQLNAQGSPSGREELPQAEDSPSTVSESDIHIEPFSDIRPLILPYGEVSVRVELASSNSIGRVVPLKFIVSVDNRICNSQVFIFKVEIFRQVIVAAQNINKHKIIEASDLKIALRDIYGLSGTFYRKDDPIGKRSRIAIREDAVIVSDMVEAVPLVHQGELVSIVIESASFKITAQGKAKEDGSYGKIIRVMNLSSAKEIPAQVCGQKFVRVAF